MKRLHYEMNIITPQDRCCRAQAVSMVRGTVTGADAFIRGTGSVRLENDGGHMAQLILDLGEASPGGYPTFSIKNFHGTAVLRLSYADWYDFIVEEPAGLSGDFIRGCCKYLGVELPVLPGNPNRFEQYTIGHTGTYVYPLIQGQQRFVMVTLETPDSWVELDDLYIYYTSDNTAYDGHFLCDDARLNKLWYASTYTVQLASILDASSWDIFQNRLLLRALTKGNPAGIYANGVQWTDYTFTFSAQIARNPHCSSGIGWLVRAADCDNGLLLRLDLDGSYHKMNRKNGVNQVIDEPHQLGFALRDNWSYIIRTEVKGDMVTVWLDDVLLDQFTCSMSFSGSVGFCQTVEKWAMVDWLEVTNPDGIVWRDDFEGTTEPYSFTHSLSFLADGAKRDRLPWIGDLDWAGRNAYYAFKNYTYMPDSLRMFALHQTPEGYIWGTCYPENVKRPDSSEYGYYESDIFSAWFVPTMADYLLFTNDQKFGEELYDTVCADLEYLWQYVEADGLFYQRYATSKGLWDHVLNDIGKFTYNNCIIQDAFSEGACIAYVLNRQEDAEKFAARANKMKEAIFENFWNEEKGWFNASKEENRLCDLGNVLALALGYPTQQQAERIADNMMEFYQEHGSMGKTVSLFIRGCYRYGLDEMAYRVLTGSSGRFENTDKQVNWVDAIFDWRGSATTIECQLYQTSTLIGGGGRWEDRSHPDTAMAHILSGFMLGIQPLTAGYGTFTVEPHTFGVGRCEGIIPTPYGDICFRWEIVEQQMRMELTHPEGTKPQWNLGKWAESAEIICNGQAIGQNEPTRRKRWGIA